MDKKLLEEVLKEVKSLKNVVDNYKKRVESTEECVQLLLQSTADISAKLDAALSINVKDVKTSKKDDQKQPNIMVYFKTKYQQDPSFVYSLVSKEKIDKTLAEHSDYLKSRKSNGPDFVQATLIYKEYFKDADMQKKLKSLRSELESDSKPAIEEVKESTKSKTKKPAVKQDDSNVESDMESEKAESDAEPIEEEVDSNSDEE